MKGQQLVCLQIHNDYQIPGGETKTAHLIADLLEKNGVRVIQYYRTNMEYAGKSGVAGKLRAGLHALNNPETTRELNKILDQNHVDFALVHNVVSVISNNAYKVLIRRRIPIIKYLQNYNLICLNGSLDHSYACERCLKNNIVGVKHKCFKDSTVYSLIKYLIKRDMDNHIISHISAFMPNSEYVMKKHVEQGIDKKRMHVMYNYVNISKIAYEGEREYYLYFGRLTGEKGVMTTMTAFSMLPNLRLIIMGSGTLEEEIKKRIAQENLMNIDFIGSREGAELLEVVTKAKAVIVPSEWDEPLPRTVLEAYSQGTPVVGADRGGIPELVSETETGFLFRAGNVDSLIKAVGKLEDLSENDYMHMRINCTNRLKEEYSEQAYFNRFMRCVEEIISM